MAKQEADIAGRGPDRRAEEITAAQKRRRARPLPNPTARKASSQKSAPARRIRGQAKRARPKQRIAISHYRDEDFKSPTACAPTRITATSASPKPAMVWRRRM